jgi:hypothetical protein
MLVLPDPAPAQTVVATTKPDQHTNGPRRGSSAPRVLFTVDGQDGDHLGRGLLGLPDLDGDGTPEFLVGAMCGVPALTQDRGYALACSGKDGCVLYRIDGRDDVGGDAFAGFPYLIGDVDGDGLSDFTLDGEPWPGGEDPPTHYVNVHSSASGKVLATYGGTMGEPGALWATHAVGAGDLDGDGRPEILVGAWDGTWIYSSGSGVARAHAKGVRPMGSTPDLDGDGVRDVLVIDMDSPPRTSGRIVSGADGHLLSDWEVPIHSGPLRELSNAGDVDGDGFPDVLSVHALPSKARYPLGDPGFDCDLVGGRDGSVIHSWQELLAEPGDVLDAGGLDDLDGDGIRELFVATCDGDGPVRNRIRIYSGATRELVSELTSTGTSFGGRVCSVGDLDGDQVPELLVCEHEYGACAGRVWVYSLGARVAETSYSW